MKTAILAMLLPLLASAVLAEDTNTTPATSITVDGVTYQDIRWGTVTPTTVTITHKSGIASIPLWKLPPDLQKKLGYDPQKAAAWSEAQEKQRFDRLWSDAIAKGEQPSFRMVNGYLYDFSPAITWAKESAWLTSPDAYHGPPVFAGGDYLRSIGGGLGPERKPTPQELAEQQKRESISRRVEQGRSKWSGYVVKGQVISVAPDGVLIEFGQAAIFLKHHPAHSSLVDGVEVSVVAMPVGTYSYTTAMGSQATVKAYDFGMRPMWKQGQQIYSMPPSAK